MCNRRAGMASKLEYRLIGISSVLKVAVERRPHWVAPSVQAVGNPDAVPASVPFKNCKPRAEGVCGVRKGSPKTVQSVAEEQIKAFARKLDQGSKESNQGPRSAPPGKLNTRDSNVSRSPRARQMLDRTRSARPIRHRAGPGV